MSDNIYRTAAEYSVSLIKGDTNYSITQMVVSLNLYEDITSPYLKLALSIIDQSGFSDSARILGDENIILSLKTRGTEDGEYFDVIDKTFSITKIVPGAEEVDGQKSYQILCISKDAVDNYGLKISRSFRNKTATEIATSILNDDQPKGMGIPAMGRRESGKRLNVSLEDTFHIENLCFAYRTPYEIIQYLAERSVPKTPNSKSALAGYNMFFFENRRGLVFASAETMMQARAKAEFLYTQATFYPGRSDYILRLKRGTAQSNIMNMLRGLNTSTLWEFNVVTGERNELIFDYPTFYTNSAGHIDKNPASVTASASSNPLASVQYALYNPIVLEKSPSIDQNRPANHVQARAALLQQLNNLSYTAQIEAHDEIAVGDVIEIKLPTPDIGMRSRDDSPYSGRYLVTAINHAVTPIKYDMILELVRDGMTNG